VNYIVDLIIAAAFVVASITGIVFLLPTSWIGISDSGEPGMLGVSMAMWNTLHEWSALIMIGGAILHVVLHWRWVVTMTRRAFGRPRRSARKAASPAGRGARPGAQPVPGRATVASFAAGGVARSASGTAGVYRPGESMVGTAFIVGGAGDPRAAASGSGVDTAGPVDPTVASAVQATAAAGTAPGGPGPHDRPGGRVAAEDCAGLDDRQPGGRQTGDRHKGDRRISRKAFLAGTAAACGGAALVLILGRGDDSTAVSTGEGVTGDSGNSGSGNGWGDGDGSGSLDESESEGLDGGSDDVESGGSNSPDADAVEPRPAPEAAPDSSTERVSIDSSCNGCGDCVGACPYGVFSFDGDRAVVVAPDACVLCGRCVRVCPTQAITLRA